MRRLIVLAGVVVTASLLMTGCEYDGPTAMYHRPQEETTAPVITALDPPEAPAGVNTIAIEGAHFSDTLACNKVYVDGFPAEITSHSATRLTIRRPNRTGDSTTIQVVNTRALEIASFGPYRIDPVHWPFGHFTTGDELSAVATDGSGNVYVVQRSPRSVYRITSDGEKTTLGEAGRIVTDAVIHPSGAQLIFLMANRSIDRMDVETGEVAEYFRGAKRVSVGDFDVHGNLYAGGSRTALMVVTSALSEKDTGLYGTDEILSIRVYGGSVYVAVRRASGTPSAGIWRHEILDAAGTVGPGVLILDWSEAGAHAGSAIQDMEFSPDGTLLVGTDHSDPIFLLHADNSRDILYKSILPGNAVKLRGAGRFLYMLQGGQQWNVLRIDMGETGM